MVIETRETDDPVEAALLDAIGFSKKLKTVEGRVRRIVTRSGRGFRGKFPSLKLGRMVHWESYLERDVIRILEYDPTVLRYQEQPCVFEYYDAQGVFRRYFPDFLAERADKNSLIEAKPKCKLDMPDVREKFETVAIRMQERKQHFQIFTDIEVRREPRFANLCRIHDAVRSLNILDRSPLKDLPQNIRGPQRFGDLVQRLDGERNVYRHYLAGHLQIDVDQPLCDSTVVFVN